MKTGMAALADRALTAYRGLPAARHQECGIAALSGEYGTLNLTACSGGGPPIGEVVRVVPNHVCVAANKVDCYVAVCGEEIIGKMPAAARGRTG